MPNLTLITDAWEPQVNGVVRTLRTTIDILKQRGWSVTVIHPGLFQTIPLPGYAEIGIPIKFKHQLPRMIFNSIPDYIHISTEGRLGWSARKICINSGLQFTTAYHTMFPEFVQARTHIPASWIYPLFRAFHDAAAQVLVATPALGALLHDHGFAAPMSQWSRGIDLSAFSPDFRIEQEPYALYVGRVSHEKQIEHFLKAETHLRKIVVGAGPQLDQLKYKYPDAAFVGSKSGRELSELYAGADVFVFPSVADTFGLVLIEALASGTPVAAYPADNCKAIVADHVGCLDNDLSAAIKGALKKDRTQCAGYAHSTFTWDNATDQFTKSLVRVYVESGDETGIGQDRATDAGTI